MRRFALALAATGLGLLTASTADAQRYWGGGRGGFGVGIGGPGFSIGYGRGSPYYGAYGGYGGYYGSGYGMSGYGFPNYGYGYGQGYGSYAGGYVGTQFGSGYVGTPTYGSYGSGSYVIPGGTYGNVIDGRANYAQPDVSSYQSFYQPLMSSDKVMLHVRVPEANAKVWIQGEATTNMGSDRAFISPALQPGNYTYDVKATWNEGGREVTRERRVNVTPGSHVVVDLSRPGDEASTTREERNTDTRSTTDPNRDRNIDTERPEGTTPRPPVPDGNRPPL